MGDIQQLIDLLNKQVREGVEAQKRSVEAERRHEESKQKVDDLLAEIARLRAAERAAAGPADGVAAPAHGPVLDEAARLQVAEAERAEKISKMQINLRKSNKVREFKDSSEADFKEWLTRFDTELNTLKKKAGIVGDLRREIVDLFKD